jgi:hypothetical protein
MTLERFGFIGMEMKCFWGMIGVEWITPLKIEQPNKGGLNNGKPPLNGAKPPNSNAPGPLKDSKILTPDEQNSVLELFDKDHKFTKLYDASQHGWGRNSFKSRALNKGFTFHVI